MTLEQCKNLEKWGLPQPEGDPENLQRYYDNFNDGCPDNTWFGKVPDDVWFCPDLEQLLEFAKTVVPAIALSDIGERGWYVYQKGTPIPKDAIDPDPKVAVYKLLEKKLKAES